MSLSLSDISRCSPCVHLTGLQPVALGAQGHVKPSHEPLFHLKGFFSITHLAQRPSVAALPFLGCPGFYLLSPPAWVCNTFAETLLACHVVTARFVSLTGHAPHHYKLISVHVFIRHGDRYPLYAIPKTKRPEIDCTLVASR